MGTFLFVCETALLAEDFFRARFFGAFRGATRAGLDFTFRFAIVAFSTGFTNQARELN